MTATAIVNLLLEYNPYDIDDPLDLPEYPGGFIATKEGGEKVELRLADERSEHPYYQWTKHWLDDYNGQPRMLSMGRSNVKRGQAHGFVQDNAERYTDAGWKVDFI